MKRFCFAIAFAAAMFAFAAVNAQEYTSLKQIEEQSAEDWIDYQAQGEYLYQKGDMRFAVQVIALGKGKFDFVGYPGGFPGEGWIAKRVKVFYSGAREGKVVTAPCTSFQILAQGDAILPLPEKNVGSKAILDVEKKTIDFVAPDGGIRTAYKVERPNPALGAKAPEGATVLFDGKTVNLKEGYKLNEEDGTVWAEFFTNTFEPDTPYHLHIEFLTTFRPNDRGQGRSNSGVYIAEAYECQVLDSFGLKGLNNECGGIYQAAAPAFNACRPPLTWQAYDIYFTPAKWADGKKVENARVTIKQNGQEIYKDLELKSNTPGCKGEPQQGEARGVYCQGHGNHVQYRNIWVEYLK